MIIARILPISDHTENSANLEIAQNFFSLSNISVQRKKNRSALAASIITIFFLIQTQIHCFQDRSRL